MNVDVLDILLLGAAVLFAFSGYRQGFLVGVLSFGGFIGGVALGTVIASDIAKAFVSGDAEVFVGIAIVLTLATAGQLAGTALGSFLRARVHWRPVRLLDSGLGAGVSAIGVLLVSWLLATAAVSSNTALAEHVHDSVVLRTLDRVMPPAPRLFASFRRLLDQQGFPQVFEGIGGHSVRPVAPPDPAVANSRGVAIARDRVLKITGDAPSCSSRLSGSGFVYAHERVMTNAHVVAGVREPRVEINGRRRPARVVLYDPGRDVAILYVPGMTLAPLSFAPAAKAGDSAIVAGYPENGPFTAVSARISDRLTATGWDIYHEKPARRNIYEMRARVRHGNSGGPLLAPDGRVYGVIFAADAERPDIGYALTASEVASDAKAGATRTAAVSTRGCD